MLSFFQELKRRSVFKVAAAYIIVGWLIMQAGDVMAPAMHLPDWINSALAFFLVLGFPIALVLSWALELTPEGIRLEKDVQRSQSAPGLAGRKLDFVIIALLVVAVGFFAYDKFLYRPSAHTQSPASDAPSTDPATRMPESKNFGLSIAVLPFVNMSDDQQNEYFSDGISEELLNVLARFRELRVAARTSAFQFKGENRDISEIARLLRVSHVLEGSVRKAGTRIRITAQLIEAESGFHLWSESYDRDLEDIFAIQDEISAAIAAALKIELSLDDPDYLEGLPTVHPATSAQAYEYYLKGRQLINGRVGDGIKEAVIVLERALELDPDYAPAHAQIAIATALLKSGSGTYGNYSMDEVQERALPHIKRAFELDPNLSEAFGARTLLATINFQYGSALENSARAMALNPSYIDVVNWRYITLMNSGSWTEAVELLDHLLSIDPLSIIGRINYSTALARSGRMDEALKVADELALESAYAAYRSRALVLGDYAGELADSTRWYLSALPISPSDTFVRHRTAVNLSAIGAFKEAARIAPRSKWLILAHERKWDEAVENVQSELASDPQNMLLKLNLANVLHVSGDLAGAHTLYQELLAAIPGVPILDPLNTSPVPTARMAYGASALGEVERARVILDLLELDQREREAAGIVDQYVLHGQAIAAAIEGNADEVIANLKKAIDMGLRDLSVIDEPALAGYLIIPEFKGQIARLEEIIEEERAKTIRLICLENPATGTWDPLPETCTGVEN